MTVQYHNPATLSRMHIVGLGAIGSLWCAGAQLTGIPYSVILRDTALPTAGIDKNEETLVAETLQTHLVSLISHPPVVLRDAKQSMGLISDTELVLMPLKAYQLHDALLALKPRLSPNTLLVLLHNGMGGFEIAREILPSQPILLATTNHGALKIDSNQVKHTGLGSTVIGPAPDMPATDENHYRAVVDCLQRAFSPVEWCEDMLPKLWLKLSVNAVINPLTAIYNLKNGALLADSFAPTIEAIMTEIHTVMLAVGVSFELEFLLNHVRAVMQATADNYSSMHQDVQHGRATEIDAINGYICAQAEHYSRVLNHPIATPNNRELVEEVNALN